MVKHSHALVYLGARNSPELGKALSSNRQINSGIKSVTQRAGHFVIRGSPQTLPLTLDESPSTKVRRILLYTCW